MPPESPELKCGQHRGLSKHGSFEIGSVSRVQPQQLSSLELVDLMLMAPLSWKCVL